MEKTQNSDTFTLKSETHTLKTLLDKYHVIIPLVQRDYAQGRNNQEVERIRSRFLDKIYETITTEGATMFLDFVYGDINYIHSLTEKKLESIILTPLDGQQRLTSLYLLHWYAAKKKRDDVAYNFLSNFTYEVRPSSRIFCERLMEYTPNLNVSLKYQIQDQGWFQTSWISDPTIDGMLVMLDAIREKFNDVENLWERLTQDDCISFYFLPLKENGQSDELYIKMNSRGRALTRFEHFKAEYEGLYEKDSDDAQRISHEFDVEWMDMLFPFINNETNTLDDEWMRYFYFISHILCYKQGLEKTNDEFKLIELLYASPTSKKTNRNKEASKNRQYLEDSLNCWCNTGYKTIDDFFSNFFCEKPVEGTVYDPSKVCTFKNGEYGLSQNYLKACCKQYTNGNAFSLGDVLFLYGIVTYLMNKDKISEKDFVIRIRVLRNLIWNSTHGELREDYMQDLLVETDNIILYGNIDRVSTIGRTARGYNDPQEKEEREKQYISWTAEQYVNRLKLEDHPLLHGYISSIGYDNLHLVESFYKVFSEKWDLNHLALLSLGDYFQEDGVRRFSGNYNRTTWEDLLHSSRRYGLFEKTVPILHQLLERINNGETKESLINEYIDSCEKNNLYDWRYYFVKYPEMQRGTNGVLDLEENTSYKWITLNKTQYNGKYWSSFANVIYHQIIAFLSDMGIEKLSEFIELEDYSVRLKLPCLNKWLEFLENGILIHSYDDTLGEKTFILEINRINNIDTIDRVQFVSYKIIEWYKESNYLD